MFFSFNYCLEEPKLDSQEVSVNDWGLILSYQLQLSEMYTLTEWVYSGFENESGRIGGGDCGKDASI